MQRRVASPSAMQIAGEKHRERSPVKLSQRRALVGQNKTMQRMQVSAVP